MRTSAFTNVVVLLVLPAAAVAQAPPATVQPPGPPSVAAVQAPAPAAKPSSEPGRAAAQAPAPAVQPPGKPGIGTSFVYGNDREFNYLLDKPFKEWPLIAQKQFIEPSLTNIGKLALFEGGSAGYQKFLKAVEDARMDKQTGSNASSEGTTSVVSKGLVSQVLALAVEEGALSRTDNKAIATFRGNALGIARLLAGREQFPFCAIYDFGCESSLARALGRLSFTVSFDTTPTSGAPAAATTNSSNQSVVSSGSSERVSGFGARYDIYVHKPLGRALQQDFQDKLKTLEGGKFTKAVDDWLAAQSTWTGRKGPSKSSVPYPPVTGPRWRTS
jgi:hypothetical protein